LLQCLDQLARAGHNVFFAPDEPKLYVEPELVALTIRKLRWKGAILNGSRVLWHQLKARHVIASDTYYRAVKNAVDQLRKSLRVKVKGEVAAIDLTIDEDVDDMAARERARANIRNRGQVSLGDVSYDVRVSQTTIQVDIPPSSMWLGTSAGDKTCSTPHAPNKRSRTLGRLTQATWEGPAFQSVVPKSPPATKVNPSQSLGGFSLSPTQRHLEETNNELARLETEPAAEGSQSSTIESLGLSALGLSGNT